MQKIGGNEKFIMRREIDEIMKAQRRVFRSENELVLHFAVSLTTNHKIDPDNIYFERPYFFDYYTRKGVAVCAKESYLDMVVIFRNKRIGYEFKYSTKKLIDNDENGLQLNLKEQSANDIVRYSFRKDIYRLEQLVQRGDIEKGYAILLTNDLNIINLASEKKGYLDDNYRFTDRIPAKDMGWNNEKYPVEHWTRKGDKDFITTLKKDYPIEWKRNSCQFDFRYCIVEV